jgi:hypothetical protein
MPTQPDAVARDAITRLVGGLLLEQNDEWAVQRGMTPGNHRAVE